ncbi:MAG: epoxide hydrolase family protein [Acidimicrobiia bacterium]
METTPFRIDVPDTVLDDLEARLANTRYSAAVDGAGWDYGTDRVYLEELCGYWRDDYDWRRHEASLNAFEQFTTDIDGERVHFLHVRSPVDSAFPLLLTHGWPGSVAEFLKVLGPLTDPLAHGGDAADAFHVVAPSLPGYGFSGPTHRKGWDSRRVAAAWAQLMAGLGYERYGAQGGDWGALVSTQLALLDPDRCRGLHLNMVVAGPPPGDDMSGLSAGDQRGLADMAYYMEHESGYAKIQQTRPQSVGYGLDDSPAGLAAWIVEKFRSWSDCGGDVERSFTKDELLTNVMLYWVTNTAASSARLYYETTKSGRFGPGNERVTVPTACAVFPRELFRPPRAWAERSFNLKRWTEMPRGGHFAAMEEPELLVDDVRAFFREVR